MPRGSCSVFISMRSHFVAIASCVAILGAVASCSTAIAQTMKFVARPPYELLRATMGDERWEIYASGEIDADAGKRLDALMNEKIISDGSVLYLDSLGGDLIGGTELGRTIRKHHLTTDIARKGEGRDESLPASCVSACALAFLGGEYRSAMQGSVYGVHRFFLNKPVPNESDRVRVLSATVVAYIKEMGVATELFAIAARAGQDESITFSEPELLRLGVVNNGSQKTVWTLERLDSGLYFKGQRETVNGINKFQIGCPPAPKRPFLYVTFDAGPHADEIVRTNVDSLVIDGQFIPIESYRTRKESRNGWVIAAYTLDNTLLVMIQRAKTVGLALQTVRDPPYYAGFLNLPISEGTAKLPQFWSLCARLSAH
jgi:hypothetical protein